MTALDFPADFLDTLGTAVTDRGGKPERNEVRFQCPADGHEDQHPSARWSPDRAVWRCDVCGEGGGAFDLAGRLGVARPERGPAPSTTYATSERVTYNYHDAAGNLSFQEVRDPPKRFSLRRPDGRGGWTKGLDGVERVLYRLPEVLAADPGETVYIPEGAKDADRLRSLGLLATTTAGGASAPWLDSYSETLKGREVVILADNDPPGLACARRRAEALYGVAANVKVVLLPDLPPKGDVSDWLADGHTKGELLAIVNEARQWTPGGDEATDAAPCHVVRLADVEPERLAWLSPGRLAAGKLTVLDGDPGLGKSTLLCGWSARVSTGQPLPDGESGRPRGVILMSAEDGLGDTIRPRLQAAGADLSRVVALQAIPDGTTEGRFPELPLDVAYIRGLVDQHDAALLIIDPLMAYLGSGVNSWRDQDARRALAPLATMADATGCAVVLVRHLNKAPGGNALYRGGGSIGIIGAARCGLLVAADPDDPDRRVLASTKSNLAKPPGSIAFRLEPVAGSDVARVVYVGGSVYSASTLLSPHEDGDQVPARTEAEDWLRNLLANGSVPARDALKAARSDGMSQRTIERARKSTGVIAERTGGIGGAGLWVWRLPDDDTKTATPPPTANAHAGGGLSETLDSMGFLDNAPPKAATAATYMNDGGLRGLDAERQLAGTVASALALSEPEFRQWKDDIRHAPLDDPHRDHDREAYRRVKAIRAARRNERAAA